MGIPEIIVSTEPLDFGTVYIGEDSTKTVAISNAGNGILEANLSTNTEEFSVYPLSFNLEPEESLEIEITFAPNYEGVIIDTLVILSNDPENPEVDVSLVGEGEIQVGADNNQSIITTYELRNHPNPFNPETTINFETTSRSRAETTAGNLHEFTRIEIYNLKGQKIRTLENLESVSLSPKSNIAERLGYSRKGYSIFWNGKDDNNIPVGSGIYFYQLLIDGKSKASRKMLLLK